MGRVSGQALLLLAAALQGGVAQGDGEASMTFVNAVEGEAVHLFWVQPRDPPKWPPGLPPKASDTARVRCRLGRLTERGALAGAAAGAGRAEQIAALRRTLKVRGEFNITVRKDWAPLGSERFLKLVSLGFFDGTVLFRAVKNFLVQFGVSSTPELQHQYGNARIQDDPLLPELLPLPPGTLAFAGNGQNSRSTQVWLNFRSGVAGSMFWETPVGYVRKSEGLSVMLSINTEYGDMQAFGGHAPDQNKIPEQGGLEYIVDGFPNIDFFESCVILEDPLPAEDEEENQQPEMVEAGVLQPRESVVQKTYRGHQFVARQGGPSGRYLGTFTVRAGEETVHIAAPSEL